MIIVKGKGVFIKLRRNYWRTKRLSAVRWALPHQLALSMTAYYSGKRAAGKAFGLKVIAFFAIFFLKFFYSKRNAFAFFKIT